MSDGHALLRAILDDPDDDAPRLIYADWLEERGEQSRAQFIRAQVELARLPADHPNRDPFVQIERTLWKANRAEWTAWIPSWIRFDRFRRGFLEEIRCKAVRFHEFADLIRGQTPLQSVSLDQAEQVAVPLFKSRALERLRSLRIRANVPEGAWSVLAESPYLSRLEKLQLGESSQPSELIRVLVKSQAFPALKTLRLKSFPLGDELAAMLVEHPWCARLDVLDLSRNFITRPDAFIASEHLSKLQQLDLRHNHFDADRLAVDRLRQRFGARLKI